MMTVDAGRKIHAATLTPEGLRILDIPYQDVPNFDVVELVRQQKQHSSASTLPQPYYTQYQSYKAFEGQYHAIISQALKSYKAGYKAKAKELVDWLKEGISNQNKANLVVIKPALFLGVAPFGEYKDQDLTNNQIREIVEAAYPEQSLDEIATILYQGLVERVEQMGIEIDLKIAEQEQAYKAAKHILDKMERAVERYRKFLNNKHGQGAQEIEGLLAKRQSDLQDKTAWKDAYKICSKYEALPQQRQNILDVLEGAKIFMNAKFDIKTLIFLMLPIIDTEIDFDHLVSTMDGANLTEETVRIMQSSKAYEIASLVQSGVDNNDNKTLRRAVSVASKAIKVLADKITNISDLADSIIANIISILHNQSKSSVVTLTQQQTSIIESIEANMGDFPEPAQQLFSERITMVYVAMGTDMLQDYNGMPPSFKWKEGWSPSADTKVLINDGNQTFITVSAVPYFAHFSVPTLPANIKGKDLTNFGHPKVAEKMFPKIHHDLALTSVVLLLHHMDEEAAVEQMLADDGRERFQANFDMYKQIFPVLERYANEEFITQAWDLVNTYEYSDIVETLNDLLHLNAQGSAQQQAQEILKADIDLADIRNSFYLKREASSRQGNKLLSSLFPSTEQFLVQHVDRAVEMELKAWDRSPNSKKIKDTVALVGGEVEIKMSELLDGSLDSHVDLSHLYSKGGRAK